MHVIEIMKLFLGDIIHCTNLCLNLIPFSLSPSMKCWYVTLLSRLLLHLLLSPVSGDEERKEKRCRPPLGASDWENRSVWRAVYLFSSQAQTHTQAHTHTHTTYMSIHTGMHMCRQTHVLNTQLELRLGKYWVDCNNISQKSPKIYRMKCLIHHVRLLYDLFNNTCHKNTILF